MEIKTKMSESKGSPEDRLLFFVADPKKGRRNTQVFTLEEFLTEVQHEEGTSYGKRITARKKDLITSAVATLGYDGAVKILPANWKNDVKTVMATEAFEELEEFQFPSDIKGLLYEFAREPVLATGRASVFLIEGFTQEDSEESPMTFTDFVKNSKEFPLIKHGDVVIDKTLSDQAARDLLEKDEWEGGVFPFGLLNAHFGDFQYSDAKWVKTRGHVLPTLTFVSGDKTWTVIFESDDYDFNEICSGDKTADRAVEAIFKENVFNLNKISSTSPYTLTLGQHDAEEIGDTELERRGYEAGMESGDNLPGAYIAYRKNGVFELRLPEQWVAPEGFYYITEFPFDYWDVDV